MTAMKEIKYYGLHSCLAIWKKRPQDIIRVYLEESSVKPFRAVLKWCAEQKKAYHIVPPQDLAKVSDSIHHEGVCILAREPSKYPLERLISSLKNSKQCLLYLDGVENPHNLGSILRTCAHFGVQYVLGEEGKLPSLSPSACRIAKGGAEEVQLIALPNPLHTLKLLKNKGFSLIGTSSHRGQSLYQFQFSSRSILILGSESRGMSPALLNLAAANLQIPGTGYVESLNVSVATSLCLGEYARQHLSFE